MELVYHEGILQYWPDTDWSVKDERPPLDDTLILEENGIDLLLIPGDKVIEICPNDAIEIELGGHWITGRVKRAWNGHCHFVADEGGSECRLCYPMHIRVLHPPYSPEELEAWKKTPETQEVPDNEKKEIVMKHIVGEPPPPFEYELLPDLPEEFELT